MAKKSRTKGTAAERELARILGAERVGVSYQPGPDLVWRDRTVEVKRRANGFKQVYAWLEEAQILAVRADRKDWLIVVPLDELLDLLDETRDE